MEIDVVEKEENFFQVPKKLFPVQYLHTCNTKEIENKKEYEFLRGNKELESIFEEHLK